MSELPRKIRFAAKAAQYIRMSTDMQKFSIENQQIAIAAYAMQRGIDIVRTYIDAGRSGLAISGRAGLKELLSDVMSGNANYGVVLVFDVSRWGRFQDADESAHYEFLCREAGISVQYCAEQFENDGSLTSTILKSMKRAMAAEYSRELSSKVFAGKCTLVRKGFRHGGLPGYGYRRLLVDENKEPKFILSQGQQKSVHTDRTILVPGPESEVETVREIFRKFVMQGQSLVAIANDLNELKIPNAYGKAWKPQAIRDLLSNEKYIGTNVFNRVSTKLHGPCVRNPREEWVRAPRSFEPLVMEEVFECAQRRLRENRSGYSDFQMLDYLTALWCRKGRLSCDLISYSKSCPSTSTFKDHFGSMYVAYERIGYRNCRLSPRSATLRNSISQHIAMQLVALGRRVSRQRFCDWSRLVIDGELLIGIVVLRPASTCEGEPRWRLCYRFRRPPDISIAVRLSPAGNIQDYLILPRIVLPYPKITTMPKNHVHIDAFKVQSLDHFVDLCARLRIVEVEKVPPSQMERRVVTSIRSLAMRSVKQWKPSRVRRPRAAREMLWTYTNEVQRMQLVITRHQFAKHALAMLATVEQNLIADPDFVRVAVAAGITDVPSALVRRRKVH